MQAAAAPSPICRKTGPVYQLTNVGKTYARNAIKALEGVNLTLTKGSFSSVIGSSGCGKSTLLKIMAGLIPPSTGRVVLQASPVPARAGTSA
jgi:NitT/TauT family transport system ATP-binding protein